MVQVEVVSPEAVQWSGEAQFVVVRTVEGEMGILAHHEPLMAALPAGVVEIQTGQERVKVEVGGGFLQIVDNAVTLLIDQPDDSDTQSDSD